MSFTRHLADPGSPVRDWFRQHLPHTQMLATRVNTELRGGPSDTPLPLPVEPGVDAALLGTAVGYMLAAVIQPTSLANSVSGRGAVRVDRVAGRASGQRYSALDANRRALAALAGGRFDPDTTNDADWCAACDLAIVLARFEQAYRGGDEVVGVHVEPALQRWDGEDLGRLAGLLASESNLQAVGPFADAVVRDHEDLAVAVPLHIGPTFAQGDALGGADADLIADGHLWELKATGQPGVVKRPELWQLAGYLLADTDERHRLHTVGFSALRWRQRWFCFAEEYLQALSGVSRPLADWRADFAEMLSSTTPPHKRSA